MSRYLTQLQQFFRAEDDAARTSRAVLGFGGLITAALFAYSCYAAARIAPDSLRFFNAIFGLFGALFALGFAAFGFGGLLGFLFGIPKSNGNTPRPPAGNPPGEGDQVTGIEPSGGFRGNTNLEEVSDWLTKIVIGVSLVQIKEIVRYVGTIITNTASGFEAAPFAKSICGSVLIGYASLGFFFVYLLTRLYLVEAFSDVEKRLQRRRQERMLKTMRGEYDFSEAEMKWMRALLASSGTEFKLEVPTNMMGPDDASAITALSERGLVQRNADSLDGSTVKLTPLGIERHTALQERVNPR
ncbi:MAG: hypothetical protein AAFX06_24540 [Planctomycetota bacterium]